MMIDRGLIVDEPWVSLILSEHKTWEMRSRNTGRRGWFALIKKGSGLVVGTAHLDGVLARQTEIEMLQNISKHKISEQSIRSGKYADWRIPWVVSRAEALKSPLRYLHPSGAVTWVVLDPEVQRRIEGQRAFP